MDPQRPHLGIAGLYTDPNVHVAVPEGALDVADEIVIRRVGVAEPRPGFALGEGFGSLDMLRALIAYQSSMLAVGEESSVVKTLLSGGYTVLTESSAELSWALDYIRSAESRGNLYLTTSDETRRITGTGANQTAGRAGIVPPVLLRAQANVTPVVGYLSNGASAGYVAVIKRRGETGLESYSAPSGYVIALNSAGATRDVEVEYGWRNAIVYDAATDTGDVLQLYKTTAAASGSSPEPDYFLFAEIPLEATSGTDTLEDTVSQTELGAPLYTNDDQEGPQATNWRPPVARDVTLFRDETLVFCNLRQHAAIDLDLPTPRDVAFESEGLGLRTVEGILTNGDNDATALSASELEGLEVGQLLVAVVDGGSPVWSWDQDDEPIRITAVFGSSVVLNDDWTGSTSGYTLVFADSLRIRANGGTARYYPLVSDAATLAHMIMLGGSSYPDVFGTYVPVSQVLAIAPGHGGTYISTAPTFPGRRSLRIEALSALTTLEITCSHGEELIPPLPNHLGSNTLSAEVREARVGWCKTHQPEHFQLATLQDFGNSAPALRSIATREAVWLLKGKGDGIYRMGGQGGSRPTDFRIDNVDKTTYLLHPNLACELGDVVYGWFNKGPCAVSDAGVVPLGGPIASETRELERLLDHQATTPGVFVVANPKAHEVIFGLPDLPLGTTGGAGRVYVYNVRTTAWTRWFASSSSTPWLADGALSAAAVHLGTRALWFATIGSGEPRIERGESDSIVTADDETTISIESVTHVDTRLSDVTITGGSGWLPGAGDLVVRSGVECMVISVASGTAFRVFRTGVLSTGSAVAYHCFSSAISWRDKTMTGPSALKHWKAVYSHWEQTFGLFSFALRLTGPGGQTEQLTYELSAYARVLDRRLDHRALPGRAVGRSTRLTPRLDIAQADARWQLSGLTLAGDPVSSRTTR